MHRTLLKVLACPDCGSDYELAVYTQTGAEVETGILHCPHCAAAFPILDGLALFTEPLPDPARTSPADLSALSARLFGSSVAFSAWVGDKRARGVIEPYAAFAPFNESVRALEPVLPHAAAGLRDGDWILDASCRTGWSGEWLAGSFPAQRVLAMWESNMGVLGYRGFRHLLGSGQRAPNLDVVFCDPHRPLPLREAAFELVHAYDTLHRHPLDGLPRECLRVARNDAAIVFPHVHLANGEPEPFFERGGEHRHGRDYRAWLDGIASEGRRGFVFSEAALFDGPAVVELKDDADTAHYNGFVAILPPADATTLTALETGGGACRFVVNPMFRLNLARATAHVAPAQFDGAIAHLLARHPIYRARLPAEPVELPERAVLLLLLAIVGRSEDEIVAATGGDRVVTLACLHELIAVELLRPAMISPAAHRLQRFHANQLPIRAGGVLGGFWSQLAACSNPALLLADGTALNGGELCRLAGSIAALLRARGLTAGDRMIVHAQAHPLLLLAALAAASAGMEVVLDERRGVTSGLAKLVLHGDAEYPPPDVPALPLGLAGQGASLLTLAEAHPGSLEDLSITDVGMIAFELDDGRARFHLDDLVEAVESLAAQIERPLWLLDGHSPFGDLIRCLAAWTGGDTLRALAENAAV